MAVLFNSPSCSSSSRHSLLLRLLFLMVVVFAFISWEVSCADSSSFEEMVDFNDDDVPVDDEEFDDEEFEDDTSGTTGSSPLNPSNTGTTPSRPAYGMVSTPCQEPDVSASIPLQMIKPTGTTLGISRTMVSSGSGLASVDESSVVVFEENTPFALTPNNSFYSTPPLSRAEALGSSFEPGSGDAQGKCPLESSHDTCAMEDAPDSGTCSMEDAPAEPKTIMAPVVKFLVSKKEDKKAGQVKEVIELEENRLKLDEHGKSAVLIDASALPASYQSSAIFQLSLRYRRHCDISPGKWDSVMDFVTGTADTVTNHQVYQESSVKPFSASHNLYLLQVDLCEERKGQVFSLYFTQEKNIRSMLSKFGSVASYIVAAKIAGHFVAERTDSSGTPYRAPDGDNGSFMDTVAATLPAGTVFIGMDYFREEIERWNLTGYDNDISTCVTSALMGAALVKLDPNFVSDTSQMFVSNAGRLYSRSAYFGELYNCFKKTVVDKVVYDSSGSHAAYDAESEKASSTATSLIAILFMYSYDFIDRAEMKLMAEAEIKRLPGQRRLNKLERTKLGNIARGGAASASYKSLDTLDNHHMAIDDSWGSFFTQLQTKGVLWLLSATALRYTLPHELTGGPKLGQQMLNTKSLIFANIMEASAAHIFGAVDKHISLPVAGYLADRAVSLNLTVPDSWMYKGIKTGVRFTINAGTAYVGINAINSLGESAKGRLYPVSDAMSEIEKISANNNRFFIDVITGTSTNGVALPLVLSLDEDVFTPVSDGASYFLCSPKGWGIGCPTKELQLGIVLDKTGMLAADTHHYERVAAD